jgi:heavy metal sensor kinase
MNLKLRNRIAFFYMTATAILTALLCVIIFAVVQKTVFDHLDEKLSAEMEEVKTGLYAGGDTVRLINLFEWEEREHGQIEVNPTFLAILDKKGALIRKTDNLFESTLEFHPAIIEKVYFNSTLNNKQIRQVQAPLKDTSGRMTGYIIVGLPMEDAILVLNNLKKVLFVGFFAALILLFIITRWIADKSILPIHKVISTAERITKENLSERIDIPKNKDEIYKLTVTVNGLLDRLEDAVLREKQFTADASHELRTPLSVIKGTLEVLIRKPRDVEQYENKITYCIQEVNRMTGIIDQLLMLARYESDAIVPHLREIELCENIRYSMLRIESLAEKKGIKIKFNEGDEFMVNADPIMLNVIFENLLSNSIKYSNGNKLIDIIIEKKEDKTICSIKDYGIGMTKEEIARIFDRFYRSEKARNAQHAGDGIGLAIVKRLADLQRLKINFSSEPDKGTTATITFPERS